MPGGYYDYQQMEGSMDYQLLDETRAFVGRSHKLMIGGDWVSSEQGRRFDVFNPASKQKIAAVEHAAATDVDRAVMAARQAFDCGVWSGMTPAERGKILWRWADLLEPKIDQIAEIEVLDNGMPVFLAKAFIAYGLEWIRYFAGMADKINGKNMSGVLSGNGAHFHSYTALDPVGVVGMILPWNGPFGTFLIKAAPALAAGCTCVAKPAEDTPLNALLLAETALEAGVPPGVLNVITGDGETGAALVSHPAVDKISFTGSTEVGKKIVQACSEDLKRVTLELGGKSPCIIFDDADLEMAVPAAAMAIFTNSGQVCFAGSRLYVQDGVYDDVVQGIADFSKSLKVGNGFDPDTMLGPLISDVQLQQVSKYVQMGIDDGAEVMTGGQMPEEDGYFFQPTVFSRIHNDMRISREEIFGPVLAACPFDDIEKVVQLANDTRYGLGSGIFSKDINKVHYLADKLQAGNVWVNHYGGMHPALPFGGYKESGWGRELGEDGFKAYTEQKTVSIKLSPVQ